MVKEYKCILYLFLPVRTFGPSGIRHRQILGQDVFLQFTKTSILWKVTSLWKFLRSATLTLRYRTLLLVTQGQYASGTQICPSLRTYCLKPFCTYTPFHIHLFCLHLLNYHVPYRGRMLQQLLSLCLPDTLDTTVVGTDRVRCHSSVRTSNVAL